MTTVALFHFPTLILWETKVSWEITSQLVGSGQTASGVSPTTRLDGGGAWKAKLEEVNILSDQSRRSWRSVSALCDGGAAPIVLPLRLSPDVPYPIVAGAPLASYADILHTGNVPFASGVGYQVGTVDSVLGADALLGATTLTATISYGAALQGGEHFSIDHPVMRHRLYRIRTVKNNGGGSWTVTIRPPLRADAAANTKLNFTSPKCVMRLMSGTSMDATFEDVWFSKPSVDFIEAFPPFPIP